MLTALALSFILAVAAIWGGVPIPPLVIAAPVLFVVAIWGFMEIVRLLNRDT